MRNWKFTGDLETAKHVLVSFNEELKATVVDSSVDPNGGIL